MCDYVSHVDTSPTRPTAERRVMLVATTPGGRQGLVTRMVQRVGRTLCLYPALASNRHIACADEPDLHDRHDFEHHRLDIQAPAHAAQDGRG